MPMNMQELEAYRKMKNEGVEDLSGPIGKGYGDTPQGFLGRTRYEDAILERNKPQQESLDAAAPDSGMEKGLASPQAAQAAQAVGEGDATGAIGSGLMAAGMVPSPASPYLLAGGLAVNVLAAGEQNKRKEEEQQRVDYNNRIAQRQQQMNMIGKIAIA